MMVRFARTAIAFAVLLAWHADASAGGADRIGGSQQQPRTFEARGLKCRLVASGTWICQRQPSQTDYSKRSLAGAVGEGYRAEYNFGGYLDSIRAGDAERNVPDHLSWFGGKPDGEGVRIGILDRGIDQSHPEFAGRITHGPSSVFSTADDLDTPDKVLDHGTAAAGVAAANRDGSPYGVRGVAPGSQIVDLSLAGLAAVLEQTMPRTMMEDLAEGESLPDDPTPTAEQIARTVDRVAGIWERSLKSNPIDVMNVSLTVDGDDAFAERVTRSMMERFAKTGVVVVAAGNEGKDEPTSLAQFATRGVMRGRAIVVGGYDVGTFDPRNPSRQSPSRQLSRSGRTTSHWCGEAAKHFCIFAPATGFTVTTATGNGYSGGKSGTSLAAPIVAGAYAVLKAWFPNRTTWHRPGIYFGADWHLARLLTAGARDVGDVGPDSKYGVGVLDLANALKPQGQLTLAATAGRHYTQSSSRPIGSLQRSRAVADVRRAELLRGRVLGYDRDYAPFALALGRNVRPLPQTRFLSRFLDNTLQELPGPAATVDNPEIASGVELAFGIAQTSSQGLGVGHDIASMLGAARMPLALTETAAPLEALMQRRSSVGVAFALSETVKLGFSAASDKIRPNDDGLLGALAQFAESAPHTEKKLGQFGLSYRGALGAAMLQAGVLSETGGILDSVGTDAMAIAAKGNSPFIQLGLNVPITQRFAVLASYTHGWVDAKEAALSMWSNHSDLAFNAFTVGATYSRLFTSSDTLSFTIGQPLRLVSGTATLQLPIGETEDGRVVMGNERVDLAPDDRELMIQLGYQSDVLGSAKLSLGGYLRLNPDHDSRSRNDTGVGVKFMVPL